MTRSNGLGGNSGLPDTASSRKSARIRRIATLMCSTFCFALSGCVPWVWHYERIDVPDAVRYKNSCHAGFGPPSVVYYPFHGIFISLDVTDWITLGLHLPEGTSAQLTDDTIRIKGSTKSGQYEKEVRIQAYRQGSTGNGDPRKFQRLPDPYISPENFGPFTGITKGDSYVYYVFMGVSDENPGRPALSSFDLIEGTIELPSMTINGVHYEKQILPFHGAHSFEFTTVNC